LSQILGSVYSGPEVDQPLYKALCNFQLANWLFTRFFSNIQIAAQRFLLNQAIFAMWKA